jgi:AcrR family transcriptional regulator
MARTVKRAYDSTGRKEQAHRNRQAVLAAARKLFLEDGYGATTMPGVAAEAGVSVETIYKAIGSKPELLKAVLDVAIVGDDEPVPMLQRELVKRVDAEPDARRKFAMFGAHMAAAAPRHVPIQLLARAAARDDAAAAGVWEQMCRERLVGMTAFARNLHARGTLRSGVSVEEARDVLWSLQSPEVFELFVLQRGWDPDRYGRWIADALSAALLP